MPSVGAALIGEAAIKDNTESPFLSATLAVSSPGLKYIQVSSLIIPSHMSIPFLPSALASMLDPVFPLDLSPVLLRTRCPVTPGLLLIT